MRKSGFPLMVALILLSLCLFGQRAGQPAAYLRLVVRAGGEEASAVDWEAALGGPAETPAPQPPPGRPLDLNAATVEDLLALPGVGPAIADRIARYRERCGGFVLAEELLEIEGIGKEKFAAIRPYVTVEKTENTNQGGWTP